MTDILERAKAVDPEMLAVLNWGALRDLISELIAEVEAKQANNEYLQKMTEEAQGIMQESQLLLCKEANEAEQLQNEVERLRSALCSPVETFGTPELVEWISAMHQLIVDFPESERGQIPFVMSMGELLTRGMNSWTAAKDARIKELEEANRNIDKRRDEMAAFIERLEAAFLKARQCPTCKGEGTIHPIGQPIDSICPKCLGDPESMAREELERIKAETGSGDHVAGANKLILTAEQREALEHVIEYVQETQMPISNLNEFDMQELRSLLTGSKPAWEVIDLMASTDWGQLRDLFGELIAEVEAKNDKIAQDAITIQMHHGNVLTLQKEVERLRSENKIISDRAAHHDRQDAKANELLAARIAELLAQLEAMEERMQG